MKYFVRLYPQRTTHHMAPTLFSLFFIFPPRRTLQKCVFPRFIPNIFVIIYLHLQN